MRVILCLAVLLAAGCSPAPTTPDAPERFNPGLLDVSSARVEVAPGRAVLHIVGGGAPCTRVGLVTQRRQGAVIDVRVETYWNAPVCILLLVQVNHAVELAGPLAPGEYTVRVNGVETRFRI
jgi:hypothetical protein